MTTRTCTICDLPHEAFGYCAAHYRRHRLGQDLHAPMKRWGQSLLGKCTHCDHDAKAHGLCPTHRRRQKLGLDMDAPIRGRVAMPELCDFADCDRKISPRGLNKYCQTHYMQVLQGRPLTKIRTIHYEVTSVGAHLRVRAQWGSASQYPCIECGNQAKDWAYDGTDPTELLDSRNGKGSCLGRYSRYPEFYMPMCGKCHSTRDSATRIQELNEYRSWKNRHKTTLAELDTILETMGTDLVTLVEEFVQQETEVSA